MTRAEMCGAVIDAWRSDSSRFEFAELSKLDIDELARLWRHELGKSPPLQLPKGLLIRLLAYRIQAAEHGDLSRESVRMFSKIADDLEQGRDALVAPVLERRIKPGTMLVREHGGVMHRVMVLANGYAWNGNTFPSLSAAATAITGTNWNGYTFFGLNQKKTVESRRHREVQP